MPKKYKENAAFNNISVDLNLVTVMLVVFANGKAWIPVVFLKISGRNT